MDEGLLSVTDLVERTGVPVATIHHYRRLGLLPPAAAVSPRRLRYDERHVRALLLVRRLRERHLALDAIGAILPDLMAAEEEEAFRPGMWDQALSSRGAPDNSAARLIAAATREFTRRGYAEVAVSDVAAAAGLAKGTIYRHFSSKEQLFGAVVASVVADVIARFDERMATGRRATPQRAAAVVAEELSPYAPMAVDLIAGALRHRPEHLAAGQHAAARLVSHIGSAVAGRASPQERGTEVLTMALTQLVAGVLGAGARND